MHDDLPTVPRVELTGGPLYILEAANGSEFKRSTGCRCPRYGPAVRPRSQLANAQGH
jgi:hypothetical protein